MPATEEAVFTEAVMRTGGHWEKVTAFKMIATINDLGGECKILRRNEGKRLHIVAHFRTPTVQ